MKKAIGYALICATSLALSLGLGGCGKTATQGSGAPTAEEQPRTQTDHIKIEGMYTNDGYTGGDNEKLKMLYVFYEVTATDENLSLGCNEVNHITIGKNTYDADMYLSESHLLGKLLSQRLQRGHLLRRQPQDAAHLRGARGGLGRRQGDLP